MADYRLPEGLSPEVKDLIDCMLKKNPVERIRLSDIPHHPWLRTPDTQAGDIYSVQPSRVPDQLPWRHSVSFWVHTFPFKPPPPLRIGNIESIGVMKLYRDGGGGGGGVL